MLTAEQFSVDEIRRVEHFGRYTTKVAVPRLFIWEKVRERELECPLIEWRIGRSWFRAVVPVEPDKGGWMDQNKAAQTLRSLIEESRQFL